MTPLGNLNIDFVFDSGGTKPGLQAPRFYPTMYQPALPTKSLSYTSLSFRIREIFWGREGGGGSPSLSQQYMKSSRMLGRVYCPTGSPHWGVQNSQQGLPLKGVYTPYGDSSCLDPVVVHKLIIGAPHGLDMLLASFVVDFSAHPHRSSIGQQQASKSATG